MHRFIVMGVLLFLVGCSSPKLAITYLSDPPGAVLYQNGSDARLGYTPYTLYYNVTDEQRKSGIVRVSGTTVRWLSGATASYQYLDADLSKFGYKQTFTYRRPEGVAGRETDENFAFELSKQRSQEQYQKQQLNMQQQQLKAEQKKNQPIPYLPVIPPQPTTTNCHWVGNNWVCRTQ